ncbi:ABC transporter permease subunit [Planococcus rifietoensis]|uniref:ABC transporter permease subunit n=1 Tax=Planococcus rifietoensis TaxID=200991 RepID=UPI00384CEA10
MKRLWTILTKFLFGVIGIILISAAPALFNGSSFLDFRSYGNALQLIFTGFTTPSEWTLSYRIPGSLETIPVSFEKFLSGPYVYSMSIFLMALALAFVSSFILSFAVLLSKGALKRSMLEIIKVLQSFPDFAYIFLIQIGVIAIFQQTGFLLLSFYSLGGEEIYLAPVVCLSVVPAVLFLKLFILLYEEEQRYPYVELARSKGLSHFEVLWKHCTSNVLKSAFYQSKSIVWLALSALLIIEHLFGVEGILYYLRNDFSAKGIAFILLSVFIPFFIFYALVELWLGKYEIERNAVFSKFNLRLFDLNEIRASLRSLFAKQQSASMRTASYKNPRIFIPAFIVLGLLTASILYGVFTGDAIAQTNYVYDEEGSIESSAPHSPSAEILFGTDPYGYSIAQQLMVGMKYTIVLSLLIASLRIVFGYLLGLVYTFFFTDKLRHFVNSIAEGMHFLPLTLMTYILLLPVLISYGQWELSLTERLLFQVLIMSLVVLPITTSAIGNEMNDTLKKEYVISSVLMGGSMSWILSKHIQPELWPKLVLMWVQHIIQVLQMFVHLGILNIFVGGALAQPDSPRLVPEIYELSGMIAISREVFSTNQFWMILPPLAVFMILIYCFITIAEGLTQKQLPVVQPEVEDARDSVKSSDTKASFTRIRYAEANKE